MTLCGYVYINPNTKKPSWSTFTQNCDMCGVLNWKSVCISCGPTTTTTSTTTTTTTTIAPTTTTTTSTTSTTTTSTSTSTTTSTTSTSTTSTSTTSTTSTSTTSTSTTSTTTTTTTTRIPFEIQLRNTTSASVSFNSAVRYLISTTYFLYYSSFDLILPGITLTKYSGYLGSAANNLQINSPSKQGLTFTVEYSTNGGLTWSLLEAPFSLSFPSGSHSGTYVLTGSSTLCILRVTISA